MATNADLAIAIIARDKATAELKKVESQLDRLKKSHKSFGDTAAKALAVGAVVAWGAATVQKFAEVQDAQSALAATYGSSAKVFEKWARTQATGYNMSAREALNAQQTFANFAKAGGLAGAQLEKFTIDLTQRAADMASYYGGTVQDAIAAVSSGLMGEAEPLRRYGVLLDDATLRAKALEMGLVSTTKNALTPQTKVLAAQAVILDKSSQAAGDAARTQDSLANQIKQANAQWDNAQTSMGEAVAVGALPLLKATNGLLGTFNQLPQPVKTAGVAVGALAAAAVIAVPRIVDTVNGIRELSTKSPKAAAGLGKVAAAVTAIGVAYAASGVVKGMTDTGDAINSSASDMERLLSAIGKTGQGIDKLGFTSNGNMHDFAEAVRTAANPGLWDQIGYGLGTIVGGGDGLRLSRESVEGIDKALASMVASGNAAGAADAVARLTDAYVAQGGNADDVSRVLVSYNEAVSGASSATDGATSSVDRFGAKVLTAKERLEGVNVALKTWLGLADRGAARDDLAKSFETLSAAVKKNGGTLRGNTDDARSARDAFRASAAAIGAYAETFKDPAKKAAALKSGLDTLRGRLSKMGLSPGEIDALLKPYQRARDEALKYAAAQDQIDRTITVTVTQVTKKTTEADHRTGTGVATGGLIRGPGTSTSDSIPAMLSDGEFVVNASSARRFGYANLHAINGYAAGGTVTRKAKAKARLKDLLGQRADAAASIKGSLLGAAGIGMAFDPSKYADALEKVASAVADVKDAETQLATAQKAKQSARTREELADAIKAEAEATDALAKAKTAQSTAEKDAARAKPTARNFRSGLHSLANRMKEFRRALVTLKKKGLRPDILQQLIDMGPQDGLEEAKALLDAKPGDINNINRDQAALVKDAAAIGMMGARLQYDPLIARQRDIINGGGQGTQSVEVYIDGERIVTALKKYRKRHGNQPLGLG